MTTRISRTAEHFKDIVARNRVQYKIDAAHDIYGMAIFKKIFVGGPSSSNRETIKGYGMIEVMKEV